MAGIYVHIPFCRSRCLYCGFYSTTNLDLRQRYVDTLFKEMQLRRDYIQAPFSTVYIGGGTPSMLGDSNLRSLFHHIYNVFDIEADAEVTIECNPDDITPDFTQTLAGLPVNRVSMGAQTFSDERLRFLRRRHDATETDRAVKLLRQAGIRNISIDLMFGFPDETLDEWSCDISHALALGVEHISAYSLMYEEGTPLTAMLKRGTIKEVDEETSLAMYETLARRLKAAGYEHYEISNFARPGFRSRHNSSYWHQTPYIGIGAAAHSFDMKSRQWNVAHLSKYIESVNSGVIPMEREELDSDTTFNDIVTTALRTSDGINLNAMEQRLGTEYKDTVIAASTKHIRNGLMEISDNHLRLTSKGIFISDSIMSDLMIV